MSTESEALRLADALDAEFVQGRISNDTGRKVAAELRRLHEENKRIAATEREACAQACEEAHWSLDDRHEYAALIRARGQA